MFTIRQFPFDAGGQASSALAECGSNWPVIYLINSDSDIYVGETSSFERSFSEHLRSKRSKFPGFSEIRFAFDGTENESAVLDYESNLVRLYSADGLFSRVINANPGQSKDHDYYQRPTYNTKVQALWDQLHSLGLTKQDYRTVRNSSLYKFSPFTSLTSEQREVMHDMLEDFLEAISLGKKGGALVKGGAGTGKSLLAVKAIDMLLNVERYLSDWKKKSWCIWEGMAFPFCRDGTVHRIQRPFQDSLCRTPTVIQRGHAQGIRKNALDWKTGPCP